VVVSRRAFETIERQIIFGTVKSYRFWMSIRDMVAPWDPVKLTHRLDFSVERYNTLYRFISAFYQRFENRVIEKDFGIPSLVLAAYVIDSCNRNHIPVPVGEPIIAEIREETQFTASLTFESLSALAHSDAFKDWLESRILDQTAGNIAAQKQIGMLSFESLEELVSAAREHLPLISANGNDIARSIGEFKIPAEDDLNALVGPHRFLCREAVATLVGPSGIGKSTLAMQMAIGFASCREIFGFKPRMGMKILIIQGENDDGDIAEMRDGTVAGLGLSDEEKATVYANVHCCRCNSAAGKKFIQGIVRRNLQRFQPDLLIVDPALCYVGGDMKEQKIVGEFLRSLLLPELQRANCGCLLLHHTNKPPTQTPKGATSNDDAYMEGGSAEFRNVARAVISLRPVGDGSVFELRVPKRGNRLGWVDDCGQPTTRKYIRHSADRNRLFWEPATEDDANNARAASQDQKADEVAEKVLACMPKHGEISQSNLIAEAKKLRIGDKACRDSLKVLVDDSRILCTEKPRSRARPEKFFSRENNTSVPGGGK